MKYVMALDQGTTSSRCIVFDRCGKIVSKAQREFPQIYPQAGWVEHNPEEIWLSQLAVIREAMEKAGLTPDDILTLGITNQRETTVVWEKATGRPICNALVWQCRRTSELCDRLKADGLEDMIDAKTGLPVDAYFSATKLKWILDHVPGARKRAENGELLFGTVDTYLIWKLTGGKVHATDYTNASRTMLFNIHTLCWDRELTDLFGIPCSMLPECRPSCADYGVTEKSVFGGVVPICGAAGDQQAALFGQLCTEKGSIKNTYGTGGFLLMNTGTTAIRSRRGLVTTLAASYDSPPQYALEGSIFVAGAAVQWLRDEMKLIATAAESEAVAASVPDTGGVYLVPAFVGLGAPYWDAQARGMICGITRGTKREHVVRAALESIAYQTFDVLHAMEREVGTKVSELAVDGGASSNDFLMQFQADILGADVVRPLVVETTALGAAYLAGLKCGYWTSLADVRSNRKVDRVFTGRMDQNRRQQLILGWAESVARARMR